MTANTTTRATITKEFHSLTVPLNSNISAVWRNNHVGSVPLTHSCAPIGYAANMKYLGKVKEDRPGVDNIGGTSLPVEIELPEKIIVEYFRNDPNSAIVLATDFMKEAFALDDYTATLTAGGNIKLGRIVDVDAKLGVGVWIKPGDSQSTDASIIS